LIARVVLGLFCEQVNDYGATSAPKFLAVHTTTKNNPNTMNPRAVSSEPVQITGRRASAVLVSEADWRALQETVYLMSIPGMADSIREGMATPLEDCVEELDW